MNAFGTVKPAAVPNDPQYSQLQWNFYKDVVGVSAPAAWDVSTGKGVVVAVIDTGVLKDHPDLANNVLPGYDFISDPMMSRRPTSGRVPGGWDTGDWVEENYCVALGARPHPAERSGWHGSHVAGTIAQETNNNKGVAGLAYDAKVLPLRVLGSCGGYDSDIADALVWAVGGEVEGLPLNQNPADIINMSLGGPGACSATTQEAIDYAVNKGAVVVVAAGNDGQNSQFFSPTNCKNVIPVGATRVTGGITWYSNWGPGVALSAPGGDQRDGEQGLIWQVVNGGQKEPEEGNWGYAGYQGTSMASPHVAATAALIQSVVDTPVTPQRMKEILMQSASAFPQAIPPGTPIGVGILNAAKALALALKGPCDPAKGYCSAAPFLFNKVEMSGLSAAKGETKFYQFSATAGTTLSFMAYGGQGSVSVNVSYEKEPQLVGSDASSARPGTTIQTVRFTAPKTGTYSIRLDTLTGYSNMTFVARQ